MTRLWKGNRLVSLLLTLTLLLTMLPPAAIPAFSEETDATEDPYAEYAENIGKIAVFNTDENDYFAYTESKPESGWENDSLEIHVDEISTGLKFVINDYYILEADYISLWYQVSVVSGTAPADFADGYWVFQDYLGEDAYGIDSLILSSPAEKTPASIVSDGGITVSSDSAQLTELTVEKLDEVPVAYYINKAVAYNVTPKTESGKYTEHATVTIPIPSGWDRSKIFGFVVEADGSIRAIPGTVTKYGTFTFTVPHFSTMGVAEVTDLSAVKNIYITFGKISDEYTVTIDTQVYTEGRYITDDGAVEYVIDHVTANDATTTYITFKGLDVTGGTEVAIGDYSVIVIVNDATATISKLLTGGTASSTKLDPLYDLGVSGDYTVTYSITEGENTKIIINDNTITAVSGATGEAQVVARVRCNNSSHTTKHTVGTVTYDVTVTTAYVSDVKKIYVPKGGTVKVYITGTLDSSMLNRDIATVTYTDAEQDYIEISNEKAEIGETAVIVGETLFLIYAEPENPEKKSTVLVYIKTAEIQNATLYYAVNGGDLHIMEEAGVLIGVGTTSSDTQDFPDGFNILIFAKPLDNYATSSISGTGAHQFYSLANGVRHDGADTDAWPFVDPLQTELPTKTVDGNTVVNTDNSAGWKVPADTTVTSHHGLKWCLAEGNMTIAELRDLFTRALSLGCDSVITFTKNKETADETFALDNLEVVAEKLPTFEKTIIKVVRDSEVIYGEDKEAYDPATHILEIGDVITYQFTITFYGEYFGYSEMVIIDSTIGYNSNTKEGAKISDIEVPDTGGSTPEAIVRTAEYTLTADHINNYAHGQFTNQAEFSYSYDSNAASGATETITSSSVTCRISSIVTWIDNFGTVWDVKNVKGGEPLPVPDDSHTPSKTGYYFNDWTYKDSNGNPVAGLVADGDFYKVSYTAQKSITIVGPLTPYQYTITYEVEGGTLPSEAPTNYTIEMNLTIPTPTKAGHKFMGWAVKPDEGSQGNWNMQTVAGGTVLVNQYGKVTLTAQWTQVTDSLIINVEGWDKIDEEQAFLIHISGSGVDLDVAVSEDGYVIIDGLGIGQAYTVTLKSDWSWRYEISETGIVTEKVTDVTTNGYSVTFKFAAGGNVVFNLSRPNGQWLDGNGWWPSGN